MTRKAGITIIIMVFVILALLSAILTKDKWLKEEAHYASMPEQQILDSLVNKNFRSKKENEGVVLFYFDPDCEYCQDELERNGMKISKMIGYNSLFISKRDSLASAALLNKFKILQGRQTGFVFDSSGGFCRGLKLYITPSIITYQFNTKKILRFEGSNKADYFFSYAVKYLK